jgi:NAD(P) transhydrogenase subunit alpha
MANVGVLAETDESELRVALTPEAAAKLVGDGHSVVVESGAGAGAGMTDGAYIAAGATITDRAAVLDTASILLGVRGPGASENPRTLLAELDPSHTMIALHDPLWQSKLMPTVADTGATTLSLELIPRTTLAQSMDVLSSQATVAGYEAVLLAASRSPRMFPLLMTAAGTVPAAKVLILGAGVAGLQAIATARKLGAIVSAYDIRPAAAEQIESVGARSVQLELDTASSEDTGGYATEQGADQADRQKQLLSPHVAAADVLITTAAIPGRPSPELVTAEMVQNMKAGSVVIDLAAERGGNVSITEANGEVIHHDVLVLGPTDLESRSAATASQMFATNQVNLLRHLMDADGNLIIDPDDEIASSIVVTTGGEIVNSRVKEQLSL